MFFVLVSVALFVLSAVAGDTPSGKTKTTVKSKTCCMDKAKSGDKCSTKDEACKSDKASGKMDCCKKGMKDSKASKGTKSSDKEIVKTDKDTK